MGSLTFKEVGCEPGFVNRSIGHKLEPEPVGAAFDVVWFVIAAEPAEQRAALRNAVPHLHVVVGTAVMSLNLQQEQGQASLPRDAFRGLHKIKLKVRRREYGGFFPGDIFLFFLVCNQ